MCALMMRHDTANAGATADRVRRRLLAATGLASQNSSNTTMTIKSSPPKSAPAMAALGVRAGTLTKRNEQHVWQRRFCAVVPQTLLYYFEGEDADTPRGVIDLEYYTEITAEPNNVLRLATPDDLPLRAFYFQADSEDERNAWMSVLSRERFFVVRDERDAYQELQQDFQAQSAEVATMMAGVHAEKETAQHRLDDAERESGEATAQLRALVTNLGVPQVRLWRRRGEGRRRSAGARARAKNDPATLTRAPPCSRGGSRPRRTRCSSCGPRSRGSRRSSTS